MAVTCAWQDDKGNWHRSLLHVWQHAIYSKSCARCGSKRSKVF